MPQIVHFSGRQLHAADAVSVPVLEMVALNGVRLSACRSDH